MNFCLWDRICNWASIEGYRQIPLDGQTFGDKFSAWVYDLGRREGQWLRAHEKRAA